MLRDVARNHKRVLLALGWYDYRLHRGIERYASEHHWQLSANLARERVIPWGWRGDGILAWLGAGDDLAEFVEQQHKPTVDLSCRRPHLNFPRVLEDHVQAAQLAADHFLSRGFSNFAFYSDTANWSYDERGRGFVAALKRAERECVWLRWHESPAYRTDREEWRRKQNWLAAQLKKLPKPLAVFAANDQHAQDILEACESSGLRVPEQVAIIGSENYLMAVDAMPTPISSIDTNLETLGYRGAELLDNLMHGKPAPKDVLRIPPVGLIVRRSSDLLAINHRGLSQSLQYIERHCHKPITVENIVAVAAMSRRALHKAFLTHLRRTPGQELQRVRMERAKNLLLSSNHKIESIAEMCGYASLNTFSIAFKQVAQMSPREFRNTFSAPRR